MRTASQYAASAEKELKLANTARISAHGSGFLGQEESKFTDIAEHAEMSALVLATLSVAAALRSGSTV